MTQVSNSYAYDGEMKKNMLSLCDAVKSGARPVVTITGEIFDEAYLEEGMRAKIVSMEVDDVSKIPGGCLESDHVYKFTLDFTEFKDLNVSLESCTWVGPPPASIDNPMTSSQVGLCPSSCRETVSHSITHGKPFFEITGEGELLLLRKYSNQSDGLSYVKWLEDLLLSEWRKWGANV